MNPNMFANVDPNQVKQQSEMLKNMSDDELKRQIDAAKAFMPGMPAMTPEMMRFASQSLGQMSPDQIQQTLNKSKSMAAAGGQQSAPPKVNAPLPKSMPVKEGSGLPKTDLEKANLLKEDGNMLVKQAQHEQACEKYFEAINTLRFSDKFKNTPDGKTQEMACRLNIALCKHTLGDFSGVVDQCEKVLTHDATSWKACFRLSQALQALVKSKGRSLQGSEMKSAVEFALKAHEGNPTDAKMKDFYHTVKGEYEGTESKDAIQESVTQEESKSPPQNYAFTAPPPGSFTAPPNAVTPQLISNMSSEQKVKLVQQNSDRIKGMDDTQLKSMVDNMKNNKEYMRTMYRAQGMDMSDEQLDSFANMMTPEMLKGASDMLAQNPDMINQMKPPQAPNATARLSQQATNQEEQKVPPQQLNVPANMPSMEGMGDMMNNPMMQQMLNNPDLMKQAASMMGGGGMDPSGMQSMMQNPSLQGMMSNPDFLTNTVNMLKNNKGMLDMMQKQNPGMNVNLLLKGLQGVSLVARAYQAIKRAWSYVFVRLAVFGLFMVLVANYFG